MSKVKPSRMLWSRTAHFYTSANASKKTFDREEMKKKWQEELSSITEADIGPAVSATALPDCEIRQIEKMVQQGYSLSEIHEETGHAEGTVMRYRRKLAQSGVKLAKKFEPYERQEIPYERDTEVEFLTSRYGVVALDESPFETGDGNRYDRFAADGMSPDEVLMLKEDEASREDDFFPFLMSWLDSLPAREREAAEGIMFSNGAGDIETLMLRTEAFKVYKQKPKETLISSAAWPATKERSTWDGYSQYGERPAGLSAQRKCVGWMARKELRKTA